MVKIKKVEKRRKLAKKIKRTRTIQETIDDSSKYLDANDPNFPLTPDTTKSAKKELKRTKTIDDTLKSAENYLSRKNK